MYFHAVANIANISPFLVLVRRFDYAFLLAKEGKHEWLEFES